MVGHHRKVYAVNARPFPAVRLRTAWSNGDAGADAAVESWVAPSVRVEALFSGHECARYCRGEVALKFKLVRQKDETNVKFRRRTRKCLH